MKKIETIYICCDSTISLFIFSGIFRSKTTRAHQKFVKLAWLTLTGIEFLNGLQLSGMEMSSSRNISKVSQRLFVHCSVSECLANQQTTVLELGLSVVLAFL